MSTDIKTLGEKLTASQMAISGANMTAANTNLNTAVATHAASSAAITTAASTPELTYPDLIARIQRSNSFSSVVWLGKRVLSPTQVNKKIVAQISTLLKTDSTIGSLRLSSSAIQSAEDQATILEAACVAPNLKHLELYEIDFKNISSATIERLFRLPLTSLTIMITNPDLLPVALSERIIELIAQNKSINVLELFSVNLTDAAVQKMASYPHSLKKIVLNSTKISSKSIESLISKSNLEEISIDEESDYGAQPPNIPNDISNAILQSKTLASVELPFSFYNHAGISATLAKNRLANYSRNKVAYIPHGDIPLLNFNCLHPDLSKDIFTAIDQKISSECLALMKSAGFTLTACRNAGPYQRNPYLSDLVANEVYAPFVVKLLLGDSLSQLIDPREFDYEGKDLLILTAKVFSANEVFLAALRTYKDRINFEARDADGRTALHYLCAFGKCDLLKDLFSVVKVNPNIKDFQGRTALDYCDFTQTEVEEILSSIDITPSRDANVYQNDLSGALRFIIQDFRTDFNFVGQAPVRPEMPNEARPVMTSAAENKLAVDRILSIEDPTTQLNMMRELNERQAAELQRFNEYNERQQVHTNRLQEYTKEMTAYVQLTNRVIESLSQNNTATLENLNKVRDIVLSAVKPIDAKAIAERYAALAKHFAGQSVIDKIMASKLATKKAMMNYMSLSTSASATTITASAIDGNGSVAAANLSSQLTAAQSKLTAQMTSTSVNALSNTAASASTATTAAVVTSYEQSKPKGAETSVLGSVATATATSTPVTTTPDTTASTIASVSNQNK